MASLTCRSCGAPLNTTFCDLGVSPLSNSYVDPARLNEGEQVFPLHVYVCTKCFLVQLPEFTSPANIFVEYAYFSSFAQSWLRHCSDYCDMIAVRNKLGKDSLVVEVASNDGYMLQYFLAKGIPVLGVEPARNVGEKARAKGIETVSEFFGTATAKNLASQGRKADLMIANNVLAHVPDINDFAAGFEVLLKPEGVITFEFPHLLKLIEQNQYDTIYHEHFSYLSYIAVKAVMERHGLRIFDVDRVSTHGGSLRIYGCHRDSAHAETGNVATLLKDELAAGLDKLDTYEQFGEKVKKLKRNVLSFLIGLKDQNKSIVGYGAAAKGNTMLNYCGLGVDFIDFVADKNPYKQGKLLPGTHIPVLPPEHIDAARPDYILILPWNLRDEVVSQLSDIRKWGGRFITAIPDIRVIE
jgi:SAM-dependent methyltransferase